MSDKPRSLKRKLLFTALILVTLSVASLIFLALVSLGDDPHTPGIGPVSLDIQQSKIDATNQLSSSSMSTHASHARIPVRRIAIVNESDHLIMKRVIDHVADHLRTLAFTESVDVIDSFQAIPPGSELYDQYITLNMPDLTIKGMLITGQSIDATIKVKMSPTLFTSRTSYSTTQDVPVYKLNYEATLDHNSTTTGYESANARHKTVAKNISDELNKSLAQALHEAVSKAGARPKLPASFVPAYQPVPESLAQTLAQDWEQLLSGHGYMTPNTTVWTRTTTDRDPALIQLIAQLIDAGWKGPTKPKEDKSFWHLRYTQAQGNVLDVFESREGHGEPIEGEPAKLIIIYRQRLAQAAITPLIDDLIAKQDTVSFEELLPLLRLMTPAHQEVLAQRVIASPPKRLPAAMAAARLLHDTGHNEQAIDILNAIALIFIIDDEGVSKDEVKKLGQKITSDPEWDIPEPTAAQLDAAGFTQLTPGKPIEADVPLNTPVLGYVYTNEADGEFLIIAARVLPASIPEGVFTLQVSQAGNNDMGNTHSTTTKHHPHRPWQDQNNTGLDDQRFEIQAKETGNETFGITITQIEVDVPQ